ncbi:MAG: hypothetical protein RLY76_245 [Actinomycetota bacterium]|jgi:hypothetical protein
MRRKGHLFIAIVLLLTLAAPVHAATPKAGAKCTKVGATTTAAGKKFTCVKSGSKLVWNKGVAIKKPTPVATATPTPSPTPTTEPTPTPTPTVSPIPTPTPTPTPTLKDLTFLNIADNVEEIALNVYSKYEKLMATSYQSAIKVNLINGPNTIPITHNPTLAFQNASKFFQNFKQPDEVFAIYYSYKDREWAKQQLASRAGQSIADFQFSYSCLEASRCNGASAFKTLDWNAISHYGRPDTAAVFNRGQMDGELEIHEHTHSISAFQLKPSNTGYYNLTPDWFAEGHATLAGKLGASTSYSYYISKRVEAMRGTRPQPDIRDYRPENVLRFYAEFGKYPEVSKIERFYLYTLGWSTIEALAAIGGIDSPMHLFVETTKGLTFKQAFKKIYGLEWEAAAPTLAEVVSKQYRVYYP